MMEERKKLLGGPYHGCAMVLADMGDQQNPKRLVTDGHVYLLCQHMTDIKPDMIYVCMPDMDETPEVDEG